MITETQIANKLVETILAMGLPITLYAEGEKFFGPSLDYDAILSNIQAAECVNVSTSVAWFLLIYGNGEDLISDYWDNDLSASIVEEVNRAVGL